ncbi:MAG: family hydrolase [Glaciihabitans sp.]|nr:family hydrolase [Glaciihabitans sp.]
MSAPETPTAVLFDIDGTLVDSNFLHIDAWSQAFADVGLNVPSWQIQRAIGADSSELLDRLIGDASEETKDRAKKQHTKHYKKLVSRLAVLDQAKELVAAVAARGVRVVLATSAPEEELKELLKVLDIDDDTYAVTSAEDVEKAKPEPDIIAVALEKGGVEAGSAFMVGDSTWDITAAKRAGVPAIALLSGGTGETDLRDAGAVAVYKSVAELLADLDSSPLARLWPTTS